MSDQPDLRQLRLAAEERLVGEPVPASGRSVEALLHELRVHQIELEIQNENLRQMQFELEHSRDRYLDFYNFAPVGYLTLKGDGLISEINLTGAALLGEERNKLIYHRLTAYVATEHQDRWLRHFTSVLSSCEAQSCELAMQRSDGTRFFARLDSLCQCTQGSLNHSGQDDAAEVRMVLTDITERIQHEEEIRKLAFYDALTQLPNRRLLADRLDQAMAAGKRSGRYGALMFVDLDNFKPLNDRHGHNMGDLLLIEAARRITRCLREMDTVARFGGDEFVVLLGELDADHAGSIAQAGVVAEKIRAALAETYPLKTHDMKALKHHCTASIGVALFREHLNSASDILKWADIAMYQAKAEGRNRVCFFEPEKQD